jgi:hypothetical protein
MLRRPPVAAVPVTLQSVGRVAALLRFLPPEKKLRNDPWDFSN